MFYSRLKVGVSIFLTTCCTSFAAAETLPKSFSSADEMTNYVQAISNAAENKASQKTLGPAPDYFDGQDHFLTYSVPATFKNSHEYYQESLQRYGSLPPFWALLSAKSGFMEFLLTITGAEYIRTNPETYPGFLDIKTPLIPLVNRQVTMVSTKDGIRKPFMPPLRWSRDGRVGVVADNAGMDGVSQPLRIRLNTPEKLNKHFLLTKASIPSVDQSIELPFSEWGFPGTQLAQFTNFCEAKPSNPQMANPYKCGAGGVDDCYDMTLIAGGVKTAFNTSKGGGLNTSTDPKGMSTTLLPQLEKEDKVYGRKVHIRVANPKTSNAKIVEVKFAQDYKSAPIRQGVLFETITPGDGRLFIARRAGLPLVWRHSTAGDMRVGNYDTVYAVAPPNADPCDVTQFGDLKPISHAPYDPQVKNRYDFAKHPFRDPMGNNIPDGHDLKGTYPWIDADAKVLSVMISGQRLFSIFGKRFENRCVHNGCTPSDIDGSHDLTYAFLGAWTKGKMVVIDNMLNYVDFRFTLNNALYLNLYQPGSALAVTPNKSHEVEAGGSRSLSYIPEVPVLGENGEQLLNTDGTPILETIKNSSIFDSIENRFNYNPNFHKSMPQDVVWLGSSGTATDELSFDDLLNQHAFIVSDMQTAFTWKNASPFRLTPMDGWNHLFAKFIGKVAVQNSATTLPNQWVVPSAGEVLHGRVEPVANGGVKGKGLYFNGNNTRLEYKVGAQPQSMTAKYWYHNLALDARGLNEQDERVLLEFPDRSRLTMQLSRTQTDMVNLSTFDANGVMRSIVRVPKTMVVDKWLNIGILVSPNRGPITMYVNGYPFTDLSINSKGIGSVFQMTPGGSLSLGRVTHDYAYRCQGFWNCVTLGNTATKASYKNFWGWMDEYKVFAYEPDLETSCNLANGTLVAPTNNASLQTLANIYPAAMHDRVSEEFRIRGKQTYAKYVCHTGELGTSTMASLVNLPAGVVGLRDAMHFPEGPLYRDQPRPDSTTNEFCLSCHTVGNTVNGLSVDALKYRNVIAKLDPRRQPSQPGQFITGNITSEFIAKSNGDATSLGSNYIDDYILPKAPPGYVPRQ